MENTNQSRHTQDLNSAKKVWEKPEIYLIDKNEDINGAKTLPSFQEKNATASSAVAGHYNFFHSGHVLIPGTKSHTIQGYVS